MLQADWKDKLARQLLPIMKKNGPAVFLQVARGLLNDRSLANEDERLINGEVCELVAWALIQEFLERSKIKGSVYHSVVLKNLQQPDNPFRTEADLVLVTPCFMLTAECKSYFGHIEVVDKGTLVHAGHKTNVYSQSKLHWEALRLYAQQFLLSKDRNLESAKVFANIFIFSNGDIEDKRGSNSKYISIDTASTIVTTCERYTKKFRSTIYDYSRACRIIESCANSKALHEQHRKYLGY